MLSYATFFYSNKTANGLWIKPNRFRHCVDVGCELIILITQDNVVSRHTTAR